MKSGLDRREFLAATAGIAAGLGLGLPEAAPAADPAPGFKTTLKKALIMGRPVEEELKKLKDAGFDGVEAVISDLNGPKPAEAEKARAAAERLGMKIHSVLRGWAEFNSTDAGAVEGSLKVTEAALEGAKAYGADAVLLVPCRTGGMAMPRPWEFQIDADYQTGLIRKVTIGDNAPFEAYIEAHNRAITTSTEAVKKLIPVAERTGVVIALENVWNNLWSTPRLFARFVRSFQSPWVKAYFDIGNHVKYAPPEQWILALGDTIAKCHVKDFKLNPADPNGGGDFVNIRDGSIRWPVVRHALDRAGYSGWMTIEGGDLSLAEHSRRLDLIIAGK
jgi:L-ribulose-5-phosphate 3-epimerase